MQNKRNGKATGTITFLTISLLGLALISTGCGPQAPMGPALPEAPVKPPRYKPLPPIRPVITARPAIEIGRSVKGKSIMLHRFGMTGPSTLIFGAIHGDEPTSAHVAIKLLELLKSDASLYQNRRVSIITVVNPDGLLANTRGNSRGVDCNRNFSTSNWIKSPRNSATYGGPKAQSEPETRAVILAVKLARCDRIVSIHSIRNGRQCNNYDGPAKQLATLMNKTNGYPVKGSIGYPTPGSFGTWAGIERKIPTITLELPRSASASQTWTTNKRAMLAVIQYPKIGK